MIDPEIEKKGGFGAFVAHEQENTDVREAAEHEAPRTDAAKPATPAAEKGDGAPARGTPRH